MDVKQLARREAKKHWKKAILVTRTETRWKKQTENGLYDWLHYLFDYNNLEAINLTFNIGFLLFGIMFKTMINLDGIVEYVRGVASQNLSVQLSSSPVTKVYQDFLTNLMITGFIIGNTIFWASLLVDAWRNILRALHEGNNLTFGDAIKKKNESRMEKWKDELDRLLKKEFKTYDDKFKKEVGRIEKIREKEVEKHIKFITCIF
jgi:hypothetical protein